MFNLRVYALFLKDGKVLVTDEYRFGIAFTKFPGGGMEFGEGTLDALRRELREEMSLEVGDLEHVYTTDFFQPSAFHQKNQIISIYYRVLDWDENQIKTSEIPFDFELKEEAQSFRWLPIHALLEAELTFPIDKKVAKMLCEKFRI